MIRDMVVDCFVTGVLIAAIAASAGLVVSYSKQLFNDMGRG
ncbi:hypothetical protein [Paenibacillus odorifer]|nr:hypothetical protein [Paenibacillus odorifer]